MVVEFFEVVVDGCRSFLLLVTTGEVHVLQAKRLAIIENCMQKREVTFS